jgi:hypothetical protein
LRGVAITLALSALGYDGLSGGRMTRAAALPDYVRALLHKAAYPQPPALIELVQTHISWVFLADDQV